PTSQYVQLFRDGCIEIVDGWSIEVSRCIFHSPRFEHDIIGQVTGGKRLFQELGVPPPIMVMLTLVGMRGWPIATEWGRSAAAFDRDPILVPELLCEDFDWLPQHK